MTKPGWLDEAEKKKKHPLCFGCGHCVNDSIDHWFFRKVNKKKREIRWCSLHGIEVGESSVVCRDGTNKEAVMNAIGRKPKTQAKTGWEDF